MCQKLIEKYSCGDDESSTFPCEDFFTNGECDKLEDKVIDHKGKKCRECKHLDDALKRIAEDASLAPEPKREGAEISDPNRPKKYFKEYIKWSKCGRKLSFCKLLLYRRFSTNYPFPSVNIDLSHPKWTDIERFDDGPEIGFEIEGIGRCHGCAEADSQTLRRMEKNGELAKPDPWGFMEAEPDVIAGSSDTGEHMSNEAIALGITDSALADLRADNRHTGSAADHLPGYKTSIGRTAASAAAVKAGRRAINDNDVSRSPSPEFDTGAGKNKGRRGHEKETYASRFAAHDDDDEEAVHSDGSGSYYSDDDDNVIPPTASRGRTAAATSPSPQRFRRPKFDDADSDNDLSTSAAPQSRAPKTWGASSPGPSPSPPRGRRGGGGTATADTNNVEISDQERQRLGIPVSMTLTRASLARFEQRKRDEGRMAMRQNASGDMDEE